MTCVYNVQNIGIKPCEFRNKRNIWMLHGLKRVLSSDTLIWCLSGIYLTVKSTLCLWFKAVCTDPISFYTKEMQRLEMDCSLFTEANRSVFSPPAIYFLAALVLAYIFFFFFLRESSLLKLLASGSAVWRVISPLKFSRQMCGWLLTHREYGRQ